MINSQSWKDAQKDQRIYKENNIQEAPTVVINGKEIQDVYDYKEYKKIFKITFNTIFIQNHYL